MPEQEPITAETKEAQAFLELARKIVEAPKEPTVPVKPKVEPEKQD